MAVYWSLAIACADDASARAVAAHFEGSLPGCFTETVPDVQGAPWCLVRVRGSSVNAFLPDGTPEPNLVDDAGRRQVGRALYARLRTAPPFHYAAWGPEAFDAFFDVESTHNAFERDPGRLAAGWEGLVLDETWWGRAGRPGGFVPFRAGHVWSPAPE